MANKIIPKKGPAGARQSILTEKINYFVYKINVEIKLVNDCYFLELFMIKKLVDSCPLLIW
jgi:hypothetical protein